MNQFLEEKSNRSEKMLDTSIFLNHLSFPSHPDLSHLGSSLQIIPHDTAYSLQGVFVFIVVPHPCDVGMEEFPRNASFVFFWF
jgi:hypothetical protein